MTTTTQAERITLYYSQGSSDKVYQAAIEPKDGGFVVNFAYGRRGNTLQSGSKTTQPVEYAAARKIYDKLVAEKTAKGYTPGESGTPYQQTDLQARATGVLPQLLNPIDDAETLMTDDQWWMQEKFDGKRILIRKSGPEITGINRKGLTVALPETVVQQARQVSADGFLIDGESVGDVYYTFDLLELAGKDLRQQPYSQRLRMLTSLGFSDPNAAIRPVTTTIGTKQKRQMLAQLQKQNREGAVFKRHDAPYSPGRPASGGNQLKLKFYSTASCIVAAVNRGKRSVAIELCDGDQRVAVGNVTIPPGRPVPKPGEIIEARYLYAYPGGSLFQPVFLGRRDDLAAAECKLAQLKFRAGAEDDEA